jgi:hypothetical protein
VQTTNPPTPPVVSVLLVMRDAHARERLRAQLHACGFRVTAVVRIAQVERWPAGQIVLTDRASFTPFWLTAGAAAVVVLTDDTADGAAACGAGATAWAPPSCETVVVTTVCNILRSGIARATQ